MDLKQLAAALNIDVPIYRTQAGPSGTVLVYCYGGQVLTYEPPTLQQDNFTSLPGVGAVTNTALHAHGIHTWEQLHSLNLQTATDIQAWLKGNL